MMWHIFDDVGIAACEWLKNKRKWVGTWVACVEGETLTTTLLRLLTNIDAVKLIKVNVSSRCSHTDTHTDECVIGVFLPIVELLQSSYIFFLNTWCFVVTETVTESYVTHSNNRGIQSLGPIRATANRVKDNRYVLHLTPTIQLAITFLSLEIRAWFKYAGKVHSVYVIAVSTPHRWQQRLKTPFRENASQMW